MTCLHSPYFVWFTSDSLGSHCDVFFGVLLLMLSEAAAGWWVPGGLRAGRREENTGFTEHQNGVEGRSSVKSLKLSGKKQSI